MARSMLKSSKHGLAKCGLEALQQHGRVGEHPGGGQIHLACGCAAMISAHQDGVRLGWIGSIAAEAWRDYERIAMQEACAVRF